MIYVLYGYVNHYLKSIVIYHLKYRMALNIINIFMKLSFNVTQLKLLFILGYTWPTLEISLTSNCNNSPEVIYRFTDLGLLIIIWSKQRIPTTIRSTWQLRLIKIPVMEGNFKKCISLVWDVILIQYPPVSNI